MMTTNFFNNPEINNLAGKENLSGGTNSTSENSTLAEEKDTRD